jgi:type I restriction enzyme, S subunit
VNDDKLVACLAKYADSQETIQAVRKAIVGLAVAGRLDDRSASQFADTLGGFIGGSGHPSHTTGAKAKGLESKFETTDLPHPSLTPDRFVRLGDIAKIEKGKTGIKQARSGPYPLVVTASDRGSCDHYDFYGAAAIVPLVSSTGHGKASLHRLHYQEGKFALGSILAAAFPKSPERISARFLFEYLSAFKEELLVSQMIGTANVSLTVKKISEVPVPIVSRMAQRTVDELMALCDTLEAEREKREATRDRLTTASLGRLTASDVGEEQFKAHADFAIKVLPELTTRPDQIKVLRQTILDLAIRGKLVGQDPNDGQASELLKRIADEKSNRRAGNRLNKRARIRCNDHSLPFSIPVNWTQVEIEDVLVELQTGPFGSSLHQRDYEIGGIPVINPASLQDERIVPIGKMAVGHATFERLKAFQLNKDDIVMARRGEMGRCAVVTSKEAGWLCGTGSLILKPSQHVYGRFLVLLIGSPFGRQYLGGSAVGSTMQNLNQGILLSLKFGLPPFAEQHRIVARVDELMRLSDHLERDLMSRQNSRTGLLKALLVKALGPMNMEARE